jgi:DNA-binding transcriptional MocR family regulator
MGVNCFFATVSIWETGMTWLPIVRKGNGPIYMSIADEMASDIASGRLAPGAKLPPHRDLAYSLGVTVGTVARAYGEATRRGLVIGEVGRGTFVTDFSDSRAETTQLVVEEANTLEIIDFGLNLSAVGESEQMLRDTLRDLSRQNALGELLKYQPAIGMHEHRLQARRWLERLELFPDPDCITICNGGQHGLLLSLMATAGHGDLIATEHLTYPGVKAIAHQLGLQLVGVAMDKEGIDPASLREVCETRKPKALYCMPVLQNPTTATMSEERVLQIAAIARDYGLWVIEDDVYGFLTDRRPNPIACHLPDRTLYVSSASKSMAPGLRIGYVVAPVRLARTLSELSCMANWMSPPLLSEITAVWVRDGQAEQLVKWHREQARSRQEVVHNILGEYVDPNTPDCYHLWVHLPEQWRMDSFASAALKQGIRLITADAFAVKRDHAPHAVRLCLGAALSLPQIELAALKIRELLNTRIRPRMDF